MITGPVVWGFYSGKKRIIKGNRKRYERALSPPAIRKFCEALNLTEARNKAMSDLKDYRVELGQELLAHFLAAAKT